MSDNDYRENYRPFCGNCRWAFPDEEARKVNVAEVQYLCHFNPPTAVMVGLGGRGGPTGMAAVAARPPVRETDPGCSEFDIRKRIQ